MKNAQPYPQLVSDLDSLRKQWRSGRVASGAVVLVAIVAGMLILLAVGDALLHWGAGGRWISTALWVGALIAGASSLVGRRLLEDARDDYFAALVEEKHPELRNRLINALQLGRGTEPGSKRIIEEIVADAAKATRDLDFADCLDRRPVRRAATATVVSVVVIVGLLLFPRFANAMSRVLLPFAEIAPYTETRIVADSIQPKAGARFPEGSDVEVAVEVAGVVPTTARLHVRSKDGKTRTLPMASQPRKPNVFHAKLPEVDQSFSFVIAAGDARSNERSIEIVRRPQVDSLQITYRLPPYARRLGLRPDQTGSGPGETVGTESQPTSNGEIVSLPGATVELTLVVTKPLREAVLRTESGAVIELLKGKDATTWNGSFVLWSDAIAKQPHEVGIEGRFVKAPTRYQVRLVDTDGYDNGDSLWHSVTLVKDQPPQVTITKPGKDVQLRPSESLEIAVTARDDFGLAATKVLFRINDDATVRELAHFKHDGDLSREASETTQLEFGKGAGGVSFKAGDLIQYWAVTSDRNHITGPGITESRRYSVFLVTPEQVRANLEVQVDDFAAVLEELVRLQRENRAQTASNAALESLIVRQTKVRTQTSKLARAVERGALPLATMVKALDELHAGPMAEVIKVFETARDTENDVKIHKQRERTLGIQDEIIRKLEELLTRLQRAEQARKELKKLAKKDAAAHKEVTDALGKLINELGKNIDDQTQSIANLEKMPKKPVEELSEEELEPLKQLDEQLNKFGQWAKGKVDELTKLPTGFVDDFGLRKDVNSVFEEIEKQAQRPQAQKMEVALEDLGISKATEMLEDLELWMPDAPDSVKWVQEEPLDKKPFDIPEMPLPNALEDLIGELMQKEEEFDEEADDVTSAWGDNLNQAGWGVSDGPISSFSAKGKTGNDLPNNQEVTGRSGDGRRGKSSGQAVGETTRNLPGRKTPARLGNERYEPGRLKEEQSADPNGSTGGGKKAGSGRRGLQGGTPPDFVRDMERLSEKQAGLREKAEQVAKQLETSSITGRRMGKAIDLMKRSEEDLKNLRYEDAAAKRKTALGQLRATMTNVDSANAVRINRARELPKELRQELRQSSDDGYPKGYESLLQNYFKALSETEK